MRKETWGLAKLRQQPTRARRSPSSPECLRTSFRTIGLSPSGPVEEGTEVTVTMSFGGLERDSDPNDVDYIFRGRRGIPRRQEQCGCL